MGLVQQKNSGKLALSPLELSRLMPFNRIESERVLELSKHARIESLPAGSVLFKRGDRDENVFYLVAGQVDLKVNQASTMIDAETPQARQPLDPHHPRQFTAIAKTDIQIVRFDRHLLDVFVSHDYRNGYIVRDIKDQDVDKDDDWMEIILKSRIFQQVPPVNIQIMFTKLETVTVRKGEIIFRQHDAGDYFYLIKAGQCAVLRLNDENEGWRLVAELNPGQGFGEEALLSDKPRNATIQMLSDGMLLRLSRADFNSLLKTPIVKTVRYDNAQELVAAGAHWLDVRSSEEHAKFSLPESWHIPAELIREKISTLPVNKPIIVYCDNGQVSASAAYLLNAYAHQALVLDGGLQAVNGEGEI